MFPLYYTAIGTRTSNQDYYLSLCHNDSLVLGVADGVGGNNGGDIASKLATRVFSDNFIHLLEVYSPKEALEKSFQIAHESIVEYGSKNSDFKGMATTFSVAYIKENRLFIAHSGDSRIYILRDNGIKQLTNDDTHVNELIRDGVLTIETAKTYPRQNVITNALGIKSDFSVQTKEYEVLPSDRVLLLTDGFYHNISKPKLRDLSVENSEFSNFFFEAVSFCESNYPNDNFTVVGAQIK